MLMARLSLYLTTAAADSVRDGDVIDDMPVTLLFSLDTEGPMRPTGIQQVTGLSSGGVTKLVERLEQRGLVVRKTGAIDGDRRGVLVELTRRGRNTVRSMADAMAGALQDARPEAEELARLLRG
jgi:DNA-binding MarR family transcriptional regulator